MNEMKSIFGTWLKTLRGFVNQVMRWVVVKDTCQLNTEIG